MTFTLFDVLSISTVLLLVILLVALTSRASLRYRSNRLLVGLLTVNGLYVLLNVFWQHGLVPPSDVPGLYLAAMASFFVLPPLLYGYTIHLLDPNRSFSYRDAWHALPVALAFGVLVVRYLPRAGATPPPFPMDYGTAVGFLLVLNGLFVAYFARACHGVWQQGAGSLTGSRKRAQTRWAMATLGIFGVHWFFSAAGGILSLVRPALSASVPFEAFSIIALLCFI